MTNLKSTVVGLLLPLVFAPGMLAAQNDVALLHTTNIIGNTFAGETVESDKESFSLHRNLIFFDAELDGRPGRFILDTGAPGLVVNHRGQAQVDASHEALGSGGTLSLSEYEVGTFSMAGMNARNVTALGVDLRAMEDRTGYRIDGFVGASLLRKGELRINYANQVFEIRRSQRRPVYEGSEPDFVANLRFDGHLPLVTFRVGKRRLTFILDTGAASNLLNERFVTPRFVAASLSGKVEIQGLDGNPNVCPTVRLVSPRGVAATAQQLRFVVTDLSHLEEPGAPVIAGILGSAFLNVYTVGIDYRRGKVYFWRHEGHGQADRGITAVRGGRELPE